VDDAGAVGGGQRGRDLPGDHQRGRHRQPAQPRQPGRQRLAVEQLHDDVGRAVGRHPEVVDLDDARVLDRAGGAGLGEEPLHRRRIARQLGAQQLHRGLAPEHRVHRQVHRAHAAAAELALDRVAAERLPDHRTTIA
jgi:hypothetical protein